MSTVRHLGFFPRRFEMWPSADLTDNGLLSGLYPEIWMPLPMAMAMYWRVKKWRFSFSAAWAEINSGDATFSYSAQRDFTVGQASILTQEQQRDDGPPVVVGGFTDKENILSAELGKNVGETKLVCGVDPAVYNVLIPQDYGDPIVEEVVSDHHFKCSIKADLVWATGGTFAGTSGTNINADIYWPWIGRPAVFYRTNPGTGLIEMLPTIQFEASTVRWTAIRAYPWTVPGNNLPLSGTYGTMSYKLLDETFTAPLYATNNRSHLGNFSNFLNATVTLEAIEYWPYDPEDGGGPIYDKDTGSQLRAFP